MARKEANKSGSAAYYGSRAPKPRLAVFPHRVIPPAALTGPRKLTGLCWAPRTGEKEEEEEIRHCSSVKHMLVLKTKFRIKTLQCTSK